MIHGQAFVLGLVGLAAAAPLAMPASNAAMSCSTDGAIVCNGSKQFGLCSNGKVSWGSVADGTECQNNNIVPIKDSNTAVATAYSAPTSAQVSSVVQTSSVHAPVANPSASSVSSSSSSVEAPTSASQAPTGYSASSAAPSASSTSASTGNGDAYKVYMGNGSPSAGWPSMSAWASFDDMWTANLNAVLKSSCTAFSVPNNSDQENDDLKSAIESVAKSSGIDARFIFATVLQESVGCVRVPTTNNGVVNPGLMQSHDGKGTCAGAATCPASEITQMITDGVMGTSEGPGLKDLVDQSGGASSAQAYYVAARKYNSGSLASNGNLQCGIATHSYCSDLANRVTLQWYTGTSKFPTDMTAC